MRWLPVICAAVMVIAGAGCPKGVIVAPNGGSVNNTIIPSDFKDNGVCTGLMTGYSFQDLVGHIIIVRPDSPPGQPRNELTRTVILPDGYQCRVEPIDPDESPYYHSRITSNAVGDFRFLALAAQVGVGQMADISIFDDARAGFGQITEEINSRLDSWVSLYPRKDTSVHRVWVNEVVRSRYTRAGYDSVRANAGMTSGELVGVNGTVYRRDETTSRGWLLRFTSYDIDLGVDRARRRGSLRIPLGKAWEPCRYTKPIAIELKKP